MRSHDIKKNNSTDKSRLNTGYKLWSSGWKYCLFDTSTSHHTWSFSLFKLLHSTSTIITTTASRGRHLIINVNMGCKLVSVLHIRTMGLFSLWGQADFNSKFNRNSNEVWTNTAHYPQAQQFVTDCYFSCLTCFLAKSIKWNPLGLVRTEGITLPPFTCSDGFNNMPINKLTQNFCLFLKQKWQGGLRFPLWRPLQHFTSCCVHFGFSALASYSFCEGFVNKQEDFLGQFQWKGFYGRKWNYSIVDFCSYT